MNWIKVTDKMPEHNVGVLFFIPAEDFHITSGMWDISNKWVLLDEYRVPDCEVTHWMELPDIPEEFHKDRDENYQIMQLLKQMEEPLCSKKDAIKEFEEVLALPTCYKTGGICRHKCEGLCKNSC